ncbi:hypothetical protein CDL15_Pgr025622 [Punica granatum]|uniref:Uncharacterized protein n=1 Tax=Punica granatum TaxID=22663 RepID=A0A218WB61_PUNGR|nr:hypothetical protein CDL15_Pgr025622 [Punica granatum]
MLFVKSNSDKVRGMGPESWLMDKSRDSSFFRSAISGRIPPQRSFCDRFRFSRLQSHVNSAGISPFNLLFERSMEKRYGSAFVYTWVMLFIRTSTPNP